MTKVFSLVTLCTHSIRKQRAEYLFQSNSNKPYLTMAHDCNLEADQTNFQWELSARGSRVMVLETESISNAQLSSTLTWEVFKQLTDSDQTLKDGDDKS